MEVARTNHTGAEAPGLDAIPRLRIAPSSRQSADGVEYGYAETESGSRLAVFGPVGASGFGGFSGEVEAHGDSTLMLCELDAAAARALRQRLAHLRPQTLGLGASAGLGDRLGLATRGHVRAVRAVGGSIAPIFAQQSIREMQRTDRTPRQVLDDAMWGVFAEGWREPWGADADHLKTTDDVDACAREGYTFFTFDPGEHVAAAPENSRTPALRAPFEALPWDRLEDEAASLLRRYVGRPVELEGAVLTPNEAAVVRAAVKYGRAVAHVVELYRRLEAAATAPFEVEVSVDETERPTTHTEHVYIAGELARLGVRFVSLAPRYVGAFEKGVDYIGDVAEFEADFAVHAAIARRFGPYKLSLHSGSDKFSVYEIAARQTCGVVHLKTAGTSFLEALRTLAALDPGMLREVYAFARERYETDRASYHVSAELERAPEPDEVADADAPRLLEDSDSREILHVTFGSVLTARDDAGAPLFRDRLLAFLRTYPEEYAACLERHFRRHLEPFAGYTGR